MSFNDYTPTELLHYYEHKISEAMGMFAYVPREVWDYLLGELRYMLNVIEDDTTND